MTGALNKQYDQGVVTRNKARLVVQGYNRNKNINYFYLSHGVQSILNGSQKCFIDGYMIEEVYVKQLPGFESFEFSYYFYKLDKSLYGHF